MLKEKKFTDYIDEKEFAKALSMIRSFPPENTHKRKGVNAMTNVSAKPRGLDGATRARAEQAARIFASVPEDKQSFFLAVANAYLDGLIAGQELREGQ